jgi:alpha-beta hydrolase superfamily lysophospholipase
MAAMASVNQKASTLNIPVFMQVAGEDYLVNADSSRQFFDKLTTEDKTFHIYEGLYHEIYNERQAQKKKVLDDLEAWLEKQVLD